MRKSGAEC